MECKLHQVQTFGRNGLVIGEVLRVHLQDDLWQAEEQRVDVAKLRPLARLGGTLYSTVGEIWSRARPPRPEKP